MKGEKYVGKPCRHGHEVRYVSTGRCVVCSAERPKPEANRGAKYQGNPCHRGHKGLRYVSNKQCVECAKCA